MARLAASALAAVSLAVWTAAALGAAGSPPAPYDGTIPFDCALQQAGMGTDFQDPGADPFCVEYDKTRQNVTELGIVEFLAQEPARFAAAGPKCWYFQRDHWTSRAVQEDGRTQTYSWDGNYWFDKARGRGGAYVENFSLNGQSSDPRELPGFPDEWKPYFGPGGGGIQTSDSVRVQPDCVAKAQAAPAPGPYRCAPQSGRVGRSIGPLRLGMTRERAEAALGPPARTTGAVARWCTTGGGKLSAGFRGERLRFALTTSPAFSAGPYRPGESSRKLRRRLRRGARRLRKLDQRGGVAVLVRRTRTRALLVGVDRKRVRFLALVPRSARRRAIDRWLDASR